MDDFSTRGFEVYRRLKKQQVDANYKIVDRPKTIDRLWVILASTGYSMGRVVLGYEMSRGSVPLKDDCPFIFHPVHGLWIIYTNPSTERYPAVGLDDLEGYLETVATISDELKWDIVPMGVLFLFTELGVKECTRDFRAEFYRVFFRDTIEELPMRLSRDMSFTSIPYLREEEATVDYYSISTLGALDQFAEIQKRKLRPIEVAQWDVLGGKEPMVGG